MPSNIDSDSTTIQVEIRRGEHGAALVVHVVLRPEAARVRETQLGARVVLDGWPRTGKVGGPGLPARTLWLALPAGTEVSGAVVAEALHQAAITSQPTTLAPIRVPRRDIPDHTRSPVSSVARLPEHYRFERQRPRPLARLVGTEHIGDTAIALVEINPVGFGDGGNLVLVTELRVTVPLASAPAVVERRATLAPVSRSQRERLDEIARTVVVNPGEVGARGRDLRDLATRWDYVIITDDTTWNAAAKTPVTPLGPSIVAAFVPLAEWKTRLGLRARIVTVTDIIGSRAGAGLGADFATGARDVQEAIRRFVRWAHDTWGTSYVLLGGDDRIVPIRRLAIGEYNPMLPTDLYYSALEPLNDEWTEGAAINYSAYGFTRMMSQVSVGRAPVSTCAEAVAFTAKVKSYEQLRTTVTGLDQAWLRRILYVSSKWGGDDPTLIARSPSFPPADNQYAPDPTRPHSIIKLIDSAVITQDPDHSTVSPGFNQFNQAPGTAFVKIHLEPTYKLVRDLYVVTAAGKTKLTYTEQASVTRSGWFYTDWLDNNGPCHDSAGINYPTTWIIVYLPAGAVPQRFEVQLDAALRLDYNLLAKLGPGDYRYLPYDLGAGSTRRGWCFALSASDPSPSPIDGAGHQVPTPWLVVYGDAQERAPAMFVLDPTEEADTMCEQEELRKQISRDIPAWDTAAGLYPDLEDVPAADRPSIELQYYTRERLRAKLDQGQHVVSIAGHGSPWATCYHGEGGTLDGGIADQLHNAPKCGIVYANSCLTNRYTEDSLSRHLVVKNPRGGAVAYVGYLDLIQISLGNAVEKKFFADLARTAVLGLAFDARAAIVLPASGFDLQDIHTRFTIFMMGLVGDPAMRVHGAGREFLTAGAVTAGRDANGAIDVVYIRPDHRIAHVWQDAAHGGWMRAAAIDRGSWAKQIAVASNADGRLETFYIGSDNKLYHTWQTAPNGAWSPSFVLDNGSYAKQLTVASNRDRRLEVIYIGSDNKLYHIWQTTPNGGWTPSYVLDNGSFAKRVVAAPNKDGRIEAIYIGSDDKLYHIWQTTPNGSWTASFVLDNGSFARQVVAASNKDGRIEVIYIGSDNKLYHIWQTTPNGTWSPSFVLDNGSYARQLVAADNADGRIEVFYIGSDNKLYHIWQTRPNGGWSQSFVLDSGSHAKQLVATDNADGRIEVIYIGSDDRLYHTWQTAPNSGWSASLPLDG